MNTLLIALRESHNLAVDYVAGKMKMGKSEFQELESGKIPLKIEHAIKLAEIYSVPAEYFFMNSSSVVHHNLGSGSNSNSGFINEYYNENNKQKE